MMQVQTARRTAVVCAVLLATAGTAFPQGQIEAELDGAKTLYREGRLEDAIGALRGVIVKLNELRDAQNRPFQLAEAHFHLGLVYLAMRDESAAIENFRQVAALDPNRIVDPDIYSPRVVALFERAREDVVRASAQPVPPGEGSRPLPGTTLAASPAPASALLRILPGTKLRVAHTGNRFGVEGQLLAVDEQLLTIGTTDWRLDVPQASLTRVEMVTARRNHWLAGMVIGAGFGMLIGALETPGCGGNDGDCYTRAENIGYGGLGLGLVGALIGALYRTDEWAEVPLDGNVSAAPAPRSIGVYFSWRP